MAKQKSKNTEPTLQNSVEKLVSEDIKREMTIGNLKDRLKEAVSNKQIPGLAVTNKVLKQAGKDNKSGVDAIMKKIKDYLSIKDNSNPEFPHQNNSKTDYESPMYRNNSKQDEYVDEWRGGGMEDLQYQTEPSDEFKKRFSQYLDGSIETGNNDGKGSDGQQVANVVPSKLGEKIKKTMKKKHKDLQGAAGDAIPNDWAHHRNPNFIPESENKLDELEIKLPLSGDISLGGDIGLGGDIDVSALSDNPGADFDYEADLDVMNDAELGPGPDLTNVKSLEGDTDPNVSLGWNSDDDASEDGEEERITSGLLKDRNLDGDDSEEEVVVVVSESIKTDMDSMKHLFNYNKKTQ